MPLLAALCVALAAVPAAAVERFPPPDFTDHTLPETVQKFSPSMTPAWQYADVAVLAAALGLATYFALVNRSRRGLLVLTIASLAWFGFRREGCVCPIGAIQNVALALADPGYAIPWAVLAFFVVPLGFALFFGRTFCAAVCPLGAAQELVALRPVRVPAWLEHALGLVPFLYLGAGVIYAALGTAFVICDYDPFVNFFRLGGSAAMLTFGACLLVIGVFVGRPYCRFLCPYGALLGLASRVSKWHATIPPAECIQCRLCEDACPYGAIQTPVSPVPAAERGRARGRLVAMLGLLPVLVVVGVLVGRGTGDALAKLDPDVRLAADVRRQLQEDKKVGDETDAGKVLQRRKQPLGALFAQEQRAREPFAPAAAWLGGWIGLVIGAKLVQLSVRRTRTDYQPDRANCVSCGRCYWYCPPEQVRLGLIETVEQPVAADDAEKKVTGTICAKHPSGRSGKWCLSPFSLQRAANWSALVAAGFSLAVLAAMLVSHNQRVPKDPLDSNEFRELKVELEQWCNQPPSAESAAQIASLKQEIGQLDARLRLAYQRQRQVAASGAWLLLAGVALLALSARWATTLGRRLPMPGVDAPRPPESFEAAAGRWAVAALAVLLGIAGGLTAIYVRAPADPTLPARGAGQSPELAVAAPSPSAGGAIGTPHASPAPLPASPAAPTAEDYARAWPRFRGPDGSGHSVYTNVPIRWSAASGANILWKAPVPLPGHNSPIVWQDRVFLSGATAQRRAVFCFSAADGKLLWQKDLAIAAAPATEEPGEAEDSGQIAEFSGYAAPTMATDGRGVFAVFATGDLAAFDLNGRPLWTRAFGPLKNAYGHAASLLTWQDRLIVQLDQGHEAADGLSKIMALEAASGNTVWETKRPVPNSWPTPIVAQVGPRCQLIATGDPWVIGYDVQTGAELWRAECLSTDVGPSPVCFDGVVYVAGQLSTVTAIRADGAGDVTKTHVLWKGKTHVPDTCSPLATPDALLTLSGRILVCYDRATGKKRWTAEFDAEFKASPARVEDRVYLVGDNGKCWVVQPQADGCKTLATSELGEPCSSSPAFQDGRIYLRGEKHLFCIGAK